MDNLVATPVYLNWSFWAVAVAAIAIVLSQLPPLYILLRRRRLLIEVHSRAHITHKVGNPNVGLFLGFTNVGGRTLRVRKLSIRVRRNNKELATIPAKAYFDDLSTTTPLIFAPFSLKPEESWARRVNFYNDFERNADIQFRKNSSLLQEEISKLLAQRPEKEKEAVRADEKFTAPFLELFKKLFIWEPGEYLIEIIPEVTPTISQRNEILRFTIYESDSETLRQDVNDYPTGAGIHYDIAKHAGLSVELMELNESSSR